MFSSVRRRGVAVFATASLVLVPVMVLGWSIGWPASLGDPAQVTLPRLLDNEIAVRFGYLVYLTYSALFFPMAVVVTEWLGTRTTATTESAIKESTIRETRATAVKIALGMAAVSSALRCIGIVRWLATMFPLAERWDVASTETEREALAIQFQTINDFGGSIGELLGVSLFASLWLAFTAAWIWRSAPRPFAISAAVVALLLALPLVELAGTDSGPLVSVSSTAISLWLWVVAVAMIRSEADSR